MQMTVEALKLKLATHCGTPAADMRLQLRAPSGAPAAALCDDRRMLGYYSPQDWCAGAPGLMHRTLGCPTEDAHQRTRRGMPRQGLACACTC